MRNGDNKLHPHYKIKLKYRKTDGEKVKAKIYLPSVKSLRLNDKITFNAIERNLKKKGDKLIHK